jgi:hypothetical protein
MFYSIKVINFGKFASNFRFYFVQTALVQKIACFANQKFFIILKTETAVSETVVSELCVSSNLNSMT